MGMDKILKGIMQYREKIRVNLVEEFVRVKDNPQVNTIHFKISIIHYCMYNITYNT